MVRTPQSKLLVASVRTVSYFAQSQIRQENHNFRSLLPPEIASELEASESPDLLSVPLEEDQVKEITIEPSVSHMSLDD